MDLRLIRIRYIVSFVLGYASFSGHAATLPLSLFLFTLLFAAESRKCTFTLVSIFCMGANVHIVLDALTAKKQTLLLLACYLGSCALAGCIYAALWHPKRSRRPIYFTLAALLCCVPLFGVLIVTNPLFGFLPVVPSGGGIIGGVIMVALFVFLACYTTYIYQLLILTYVVLALCFPAKYPSQVGIPYNTTNLAMHDSDVFKSLMRAQDALHLTSSSKARLNIFPEFYFGPVSRALDQFWQVQNPSNLALGGAVKVNPDGTLVNAIVRAGAFTTPLYMQRYPIPFSMWHPWNRKEHFISSSNSRIGYLLNKRTAFFLCYEAILPAAYLEALLGAPRQIIALSSTPWETTGHVRRLQHLLLSNLARISNAKLAIAYRLPPPPPSPTNSKTQKQETLRL